MLQFCANYTVPIQSCPMAPLSSQDQQTIIADLNSCDEVEYVH